MLIEPVNFPQAAADPVSDHCFTQLFTNGYANPIGGAAIGSGIEHKITVCLTVGMIKPPKNMIQLQAFGKFHFYSPLKNKPFLFYLQKENLGTHERKDTLQSARDFVANEANETQEYFVYFKFRLCTVAAKDPVTVNWISGNVYPK